ncbi:MAG: metallophosphoesterase [Clostridia bacterium]|nr:metallophosphoesterase [Clostridia bacterium]
MKPFKFFLLTDTHYFAPKLGCYGEEYKKFMQFEQKCFAETSAINKAAFKWLETAKEADAVLIAGDLSFNGEKESHLEFIELLRSLKKAGKKIYVITAGHDFNDKVFAFNDTGRLEFPGTKREELFDLYYEFGFSDAISVHKDSLSYVAQLSDGIRLLALNNDGDNANKHTYTASQTEWILKQTKKAREDGQMMFVMNHYPLLPGCPLFSLVGDAVMPNADKITSMLADEGVHLSFTGHMHNQSIKMKLSSEGNRFWDVCTGSLIGCPAYMRLVEIQDKSTVKIESIPVPEFDWDMQGLTNEEYFRRQFDMMINTYLDCLSEDPKRLLGKFGMKDPNPALIKICTVIGNALNNATIGSLCAKLFVKCDEAIKDRPVRDFMLEIVRNVFVGNAPYVAGTPEYEAFMGILDRFSPLLSLLGNAVKINGKKADIRDILKNCIGHYGVDEYNTTITLE